ncbi:DNA cytosine methyltransferase [Stackebrandtia nassauensis]|uniref:DNA cytosine methyltransferase n=1 Tax=Stackebrandtia nassauensis TaxID=283811 RepID=UPI0001A3870C|nr:DNA cytosine methyltransferase [Stackebrandtia nassauensis]
MTTLDRDTLMRRLTESIDALAYPFAHREVVETTHNGRPHRYPHITRHPPLIVQLARAIETSSGEAGEPLAGFRGIFTSEPAARLDAIDRHEAINAAARDWLSEMDIRPRRATVDNLRALVGGAARLDAESLAALTRDARSWWVWARTITGWDSAPWKPHGPCPQCERLGTLRVREAARTAMCVECGAWWDPGGIHTLAAFVRMWHESQVPCELTSRRPDRDRHRVNALPEVSLQQDTLRTRPQWRVFSRRVGGELVPRIGSLCSGIGALDDAVAAVTGAELAWVADTDPDAARVLTHRHPHAPNLGDIRTAPWEDAEPVDILVAGVPCQPVSKAGKRTGVADARWLWPHAARAVRDLRPALIVLENVAALRTRGLGDILTDLAALGYDARWLCLRACELGAPHQRDRMFLAAATHPQRHPRSQDHPNRFAAAGSGRTPSHPASQRRHQRLTPPTGLQRGRDLAVTGAETWGKYAPAIARWEHLTARPAPAPTAPTGRGEARRLSPRFVEWMMGINSGHVTDVEGISRTAQLRLLGNSVVPAQAEAAVRLLLDDTLWPRP